MANETFLIIIMEMKALNFHSIVYLNNLSQGNASSIYRLKPSCCTVSCLTEWGCPLKAAGAINRGVCISTTR